MTAPSKANNPELIIKRPAPFVEALPAADPVVEGLLAPAPVEILPEAVVDGEAVPVPKSCAEE